MNYFVAFDTETGGIGDDKSILTAYFGLFIKEDNKFKLIDELDLKIKPNDDIYRITAESLEINQIDLKQHNKIAITEKQAGTKLYDKLHIWYTDSGEKLIPVGHNVGFDIRKITTTIIHTGSWEQYVSYRVLDTCTIAQFLRLKGDLPKDLSCSLGKLGQYFKIYNKGELHEAKYDTLLTINVLENLINL
jgi:hypothetical protein